MFKVIVERPRVGHKDKAGDLGPAVIKGDADDLPKLEPMSKKYKVKRIEKRLNENLSPLYRFLRGAIGRKWNDIWSELCENLDDKSAVKKHVKDHAKDFAETNIQMLNGQPYELSRWEGWIPLYSSKRYPAYYVDPETNLLCLAPFKEKEKPYKAPTAYNSKDNKVYYQFEDNAWWLVRKKIRKEEVQKPIYGYYKKLIQKGDDISEKIAYGRIGTKPVTIYVNYEVKKKLKGDHLNTFKQWLRTKEWNSKAPKGRQKYLRK